MKKKKKILVCIGTRADAIKLCPLYHEFARCDSFEVLLVNCGQHLELIRDVLEYFQVTPDYSLGIMKHGREPLDTAAIARERLSPILSDLRPDMLIVQGDTASSLGCAEAGADAGVCVVHVEAGLRTHDYRDPYPEEEFRVRISALSSLHFAPTEGAKRNLTAEGVEDTRIFTVGNTVTDALRRELEQPRVACELVRSLDYRAGVLLLTCHRRENLTETDGRSGAENIFSAVSRLIEKFPALTVVFPIHKNERVREIYSRVKINSDRMLVCEPLDYPSLVYLLSRARLVITDSGGICEEATSLGTPTVIARNLTERPEALRSGIIKLSGRDEESVYSAAIDLLEKEAPTAIPRKFCDFTFGDGKVCERIVDRIRRQWEV